MRGFWDAIWGVYANTDDASFTIMIFIVVAGGMVLGEVGRIVQVTAGTLVNYSLISLGYAWLIRDKTVSLNGIWQDLGQLTGQDVVAHFLVFAVTITTVHVIRNAVATAEHEGAGGSEETPREETADIVAPSPAAPSERSSSPSRSASAVIQGMVLAFVVVGTALTFLGLTPSWFWQAVLLAIVANALYDVLKSIWLAPSSN